MAQLSHSRSDEPYEEETVDKLAVHVHIKEHDDDKGDPSPPIVEHLEDKAGDYLMLLVVFLLGAISWQIFLVFIHAACPKTVIVSTTDLPKDFLTNSELGQDFSPSLLSSSSSLSSSSDTSMAAAFDQPFSSAGDGLHMPTEPHMPTTEAHMGLPDQLSSHVSSSSRGGMRVIRLRVPFRSVGAVLNALGVLNNDANENGNENGFYVKSISVRLCGWLFDFTGLQKAREQWSRLLGISSFSSSSLSPNLSMASSEKRGTEDDVIQQKEIEAMIDENRPHQMSVARR